MCTRPAAHADLDHTVDWLDHGDTVAWNLGAACRHCHRVKHQGGWTLDQPESGRFVWHTLLGARYTVAPRPVLTDPPPPLGPRPDRRPRPVVDVEPPPAHNDDGWIGTGWDTEDQPGSPTGGPTGTDGLRRSSRYTRPREETSRPTTGPTRDDYPDEPPF